MKSSNEGLFQPNLSTVHLWVKRSSSLFIEGPSYFPWEDDNEIENNYIYMKIWKFSSLEALPI